MNAVTSPAIAARGVVRRYGRREALRGVSLSAAAGELVAVIGPNGAGKTTLLEILAGIQRPDSGELVLPPGGSAWVPQRSALYGRLTVAENLRLFARLERRPDPAADVARMLAETRLEERAGDLVATLSGGNRQRVNVALGLLGDPPVLLLDEPTTALDPAQRERVWSFVRGRAARGTAVIFSTHDVAEAEREATRALVLADGEMLFDGPPPELARRAGGGRDFEAAFLSFLRAEGHA